jgi:hypothetical protein
MIGLAARVVAVHAALAEAEIPHAFGGALALAFHIQEPRGTRDIDINVFAEVEDAERVFRALPSGVVWSADDVERVMADGQVRLLWDETPVDLFFSTHEFHGRAEERIEEVPFEGAMIPVLGAVELLVFKAIFNRTKDWADIEAMLEVESFDVHQALGWLVDLLSAEDSRTSRLRELVRARPGQ